MFNSKKATINCKTSREETKQPMNAARALNSGSGTQVRANYLQQFAIHSSEVAKRQCLCFLVSFVETSAGEWARLQTSNDLALRLTVRANKCGNNAIAANCITKVAAKKRPAGAAIWRLRRNFADKGISKPRSCQTERRLFRANTVKFSNSSDHCANWARLHVHWLKTLYRIQ